MRLKAIYHGDELCLATEAGEIIESVGGCEIRPLHLSAQAGDYIKGSFEVIVRLESTTKIVDADVRALPEPRIALPRVVDHDYDYYEDFLHDEDCDCEGCFMEGLCPDCCQDRCLQCNQCKTPACEAENCDCP